MSFITALSSLINIYSTTGSLNSLLANNDSAIDFGFSDLSALITGFACSFVVFGFVDDAPGLTFVTVLLLGDGLTATFDVF